MHENKSFEILFQSLIFLQTAIIKIVSFNITNSSSYLAGMFEF